MSIVKVWVGQIPGPLGIAVGVAYFWSKPCETKRPMPGAIKHMATRSLLHSTHLPLAELRTSHPQTNLHTSEVAGTFSYTVRGLSANCGQSYQPLHSQSPCNKRKVRKGMVKGLRRNTVRDCVTGDVHKAQVWLDEESVWTECALRLWDCRHHLQPFQQVVPVREHGHGPRAAQIHWA